MTNRMTSQPGDAPRYRLRLFVAGQEPNSAQALVSLERVCRERLAGACELQIVDVFEDYQAAIAQSIVAVPALIVEWPPPRRVIVGFLADEPRLLAALGLAEDRSDVGVQAGGEELRARLEQAEALVTALHCGQIDALLSETRPLLVRPKSLVDERARLRIEAERLARQWQATFDAVPDAIWLLDEQQRVVRANRAAAKMFHCPLEEMIGAHCYPIVHGTTAPIPDCPFCRMRETRARESLEMQSGERWFLVTVDPILDEEGHLTGAVHIATDITERKRAEEKIRESEETYRNLFQNAQVGLFRTRISDGKILECNEQLARMFGYDSREEFIAEYVTSQNYVDPGTRERMLSELWEKGTIQNFQARFYRKDGSIFWAQYSARIYPEKGWIEGVAEDITARKEAEQTVARQMQDLQTLYEASQQLRRTLDLEQIYTTIYHYVRQSMPCDSLFLSDYDAEHELITCRAAWNDDVRLDVSNFPPIPLEPEGQGTQSVAIRTGQSLLLNDYEYRLVGNRVCYYGDEQGAIYAEIPDEAPRTRSALIVPLVVEGRVTGVLQVFSNDLNAFTSEHLRLLESLATHIALAIHNANLYQAAQREIAERRQAEEALRASERRYAMLVEASPAGIFRTDAQGYTTYVSPRWCQIAGLEAEAALGNGWLAAVHPDDRGKLASGWAEAARAGRTSAAEYRFVHPDGTIRWVAGQAVPERDGRGCVIGYVGVITDITEQKQAEEERKRLQEQLYHAQRMESVGRLAGGIAHDFNNILSVILGYGEVGLRKVHPRDPLTVNFQQIVEAAQRASALTRQLLAFSRKQTLQPKVLNLNTIVQNLKEMLERLIGEDIALQLYLDPDLALVEVDPGQMEQVIMNLVVNARDAMPQGGQLIIETRNVELDEAYAQTHAEVISGPYVLLAVTDTGCGMEPDLLDKIFEPFFTTKEKGQGTGLGLSTVYGIVRQSGGTIWVYSEPGQGTTFKIYLPQSQGVPVTKPELRPEREPVGLGQQILVVEDEAAVRELLDQILTSVGYRVTVAANGGEALLWVEEKGLRPDLLLVDVILPGMDGSVLAARLQQSRPGLKVLYMSGYTDNIIAHRGVLDPGTHFIQKPFTMDNLTQKVQEVLWSP